MTGKNARLVKPLICEHYTHACNFFKFHRHVKCYDICSNYIPKSKVARTTYENMYNIFASTI